MSIEKGRLLVVQINKDICLFCAEILLCSVQNRDANFAKKILSVEFVWSKASFKENEIKEKTSQSKGLRGFLVSHREFESRTT